MKTLFVSLVALSFLFFFACQESNITDPVQEEAISLQQTELQSDKDQQAFNTPNILELKGFLYDPVHKSDLKFSAELSGNIFYGHKFVLVDPAPPAPQSYVGLKIRVDADVVVQCPYGEKIWNVNRYVEDVVYIPHNGDPVVYLEKSFSINNPCCHPVELVFKFQVTKETLSIKSVWLRKSLTDQINDTY